MGLEAVCWVLVKGVCRVACLSVAQVGCLLRIRTTFARGAESMEEAGRPSEDVETPSHHSRVAAFGLWCLDFPEDGILAEEQEDTPSTDPLPGCLKYRYGPYARTLHSS